MINYLFITLLSLLSIPQALQSAPSTDIEVQSYQWPKTNDFPQKLIFFVLAGGTSTGKSTVLDSLRTNKDFILKIKNTLEAHYINPPSITIAFSDEIPLKVIKDWRSNNKFDKMIKGLQTGNKTIFQQFQQDILSRQIQQINSLPKTGLVVVITDRYIFDIIGYSQMNGLPGNIISQMFGNHMNQSHIHRVFMFKDYIQDTSKENDRFTECNQQKMESEKSYDYINKVYRKIVDHSKITYISHNKKLQLKQSIKNRIEHLQQLILQDLTSAFPPYQPS